VNGFISMVKNVFFSKKSQVQIKRLVQRYVTFYIEARIRRPV
jgi:hypothetical protein